MDQPGSPELRTYPVWDYRRGSRRALLLVLTALVLVVVGVVIGVFLLLRGVTHPNDETARYLPADTDIYYSFNMLPGAGQLLQARNIISRYTNSAAFQDKVDDFVDPIERETGVDLIEDVLPWLGPELALGIINADTILEDPEVVGFIGTKDPGAAEKVLRKVIEYMEDELEADFLRGTYGEVTTYLEKSGVQGIHFAITEHYLVMASKENLLENTLDMMVKPENSLWDKYEFKDARESVLSRRFSFLYVDLDNIIGPAIDQAGIEGALGANALGEIRDNIPRVLGLSGSFVDKGIRIDGFYDTPEGGNLIGSANSLGSASLIPDDSMALISVTGLTEAWEEFEGSLDLGPAVRDVDAEFGIDIDRDILGWITGEVAIAVLSNNFPSDLSSVLEDAIGTLVFFEFSDYRDAEDALGNIVDAMEDLGVPFSDAEIEGQEATMVDLDAFFEDILEDIAYRPGFMLLDHHVVFGTTKGALRAVVEVENGDEVPLSSDPEFSRVIEMVPEGKHGLLFLNAKDIIQALEIPMDAETREQYRVNVAPYVEPIRTLMGGVEMNEEVATFTFVVTIQ